MFGSYMYRVSVAVETRGATGVAVERTGAGAGGGELGWPERVD